MVRIHFQIREQKGLAIKLEPRVSRPSGIKNPNGKDCVRRYHEHKGLDFALIHWEAVAKTVRSQSGRIHTRRQTPERCAAAWSSSDRCERSDKAEILKKNDGTCKHGLAPLAKTAARPRDY